MKWFEAIAVIVGIGTLTQFVSWVLKSIGLTETLGSPLILFLSAIFSLLVVIILILNQVQGENREIKKFLKTKGFKEKEGVVEKFFKRANKRGVSSIDSRILWIIIAFILFYLIIKSQSP